MLLLITYDLHNPERDYDDVIEAIKSFGACAHIEGSVWIVDTSIPPKDCLDSLKGVATRATYFVVELRKHWSSFNIGNDVAAWLKRADRSWR